jgi:hypothetical protein
MMRWVKIVREIMSICARGGMLRAGGCGDPGLRAQTHVGQSNGSRVRIGRFNRLSVVRTRKN